MNVNRNERGLRIYYFCGAADIVSDFWTWSEKTAASSFGGGVFMEQFFDLCERLNAQAHLVSSANGQSMNRGRFILEYYNPHSVGEHGLRYHVTSVLRMLHFVVAIRRFKADVVLMAIEERYWFVLFLLYFTKIKFVPFLHSTLWPRLYSFDKDLSAVQKILSMWSGSFIRRRCRAVLSISDQIRPQIEKVTSRHPPPIIRFRPIYERAMFAGIKAPDWERRPFRVVYVGRVTADKGIWDIVEVARALRARGERQVLFDICGEGRDRDAMQRIVREEGLDEINIHGQCGREKLHFLYSQSHVVLVPTARAFPEGFNRVSIEAVLSGRPIVASTSAIEPDIETAAVVVGAGDVEGYVEALLSLSGDRERYQSLASGARRLQELFYDATLGWESAFERAIAQ